MLGQLQEQIAGYQAPHDLTRDEFIGFVSPVTPGVYMADRSDTHLRLDFDEPPLWDIFLKGPAIAHFQAVF